MVVTLAGNILLQQSSLRKIVSEANQYLYSINTFKANFYALPGDMSDATSYWSSTANGNGNGQIQASGGANDETLLAWQHLYYAGMIPNNFSSAIANGTHTIGTNYPASTYSGGGFSVRYATLYSLARNRLYFGGQVSVANSIAYGAILKPMDAKYIDDKIDDGSPGSGIISGNDGYSNVAASTVSCCSAAGCTVGSSYSIAVESARCYLTFDQIDIR